MAETPFSDLETGDDSCFLCGTKSGAITQEHVFPKWLLQRFGLWNQRIGLLNDTNIQYRSLLIPCCASCNNEDLARLESLISSSVFSGHDACLNLGHWRLYLWVSKLFYGTLRKEINLARDRARPSEGNIIPSTVLNSFSNLHLFLQGIRGRHRFSSAPPYSVLVCNLHDLAHPHSFSFADNPIYMTAAIRMGEVGVIVALEDAGLATQSFGRYVSAVNGRKLHPIQFDELYAKVTYQVSLIETTVRYISSRVGDDSRSTRTDVLGGGRLRQWSQEEFSHVLRAHVGSWLKSPQADEWFAPPDLVPTWMVDGAGELLCQPLSSWEGRGELNP
jgi:hypothetical protein